MEHHQENCPGNTAQFRQIYEDIMSLEGSYQPSTIVDDLFSNLVAMAIKTCPKHDFCDQEVNKIQRASNLAEVELEKHWARKIIAAADPVEETEKFPYIGNYRDLTEMELGALTSSVGKRIEEPVVFVGGGLPLTAYVLARDYGISSVVLENDEEMIDLAKGFIKKVGVGRVIEIVRTGGETFERYGRTVIVAALAGVDDEVKEKIFNIIPKSSTVLARTVEVGSNRELLYRPLPTSTLASRKVTALIHPRQTVKYQSVINSVAIFGGLSNAA